jgi:hypothetical protein
MKILPFALAGMLLLGSTGARAEGEALRQSSEFPANGGVRLAERLQIGLSTLMNGNLGENTFSERDSSPVADYGCNLEARYFFTESFALGMSLGIVSGLSDFTQGRAEGERAAGYYQLHPFLLSMRYQHSSLFGVSRLRPYFQGEAGPTVIQYYSGLNRNLAQLTVRGSTGFDLYFSESARFFTGVQFSYLKSKDLGYAQTAFNLGLLL